MRISLTEGARSFLRQKGEASVTIASLVFSSCCSGPLPPEVRPGVPSDPHGFTVVPAGDVTVFYDSLLDPRPDLRIDVKDYGKYQELFVQGWE